MLRTACLGLLALALLLPHLMGLRDSRLLWCWLLVWAGIAVQTVDYVLAMLPDTRDLPVAVTLNILAAGFWATAWSVHYVTLRGISPHDLVWPAETTSSEAQRLQRAFRLTYAGCYRLLRDTYGARRTQALDDRMDVLAATANWDITLDRDEARISVALAARPLDVQGARYAEALRYTVATIQEIAGASFGRRAIQAAYDALPWPEREAADRRCFPNTPWAQELSRSFGSARSARIRLLRQVDLFAACDDDELAELAAALQPRRVPAGHEVLARGAAPPGLWIVEAGEILAWEDRQTVDELHRGEVFGIADPRSKAADSAPQSAIFHLQSAACSYRATVESDLLFLPAAEFQRLLREEKSHTAEGLELLRVLRLLERVPLFADMPRHTLRGLARVAERREVAPRTIIVRQGQPSGTFYIIKQGQAAVVVRGAAAEDGAAGAAKVVSQLGPEEFFGELELLRGIPPVASVVAIGPVVLLALPHEAIAALLVGSASVARGLEQVGTGRLIDLRERATA
jgi:putative peptide zinc metalloprotease protein